MVTVHRVSQSTDRFKMCIEIRVFAVENVVLIF